MKERIVVALIIVMSLIVGATFVVASTGVNQLVDDSNQTIHGLLEPNGTTRVITTGAVSARTAADFTTKVVRIVCSEAAFIEFGTSAVTAANTDMLMPQNSVEYFNVGPHVRVAAIQSTAAGTCNVTEMK